MNHCFALPRVVGLLACSASLVACGGPSPLDSSKIAAAEQQALLQSSGEGLNYHATIAQGVVTGTPPDAAGIVSYKGLPYAAPPEGSLRWKSPQPPSAWTVARDATKFGHTCWQGTAFGPVDNSQASEDCLFANVWTGARSPSERRPVMVWLHGGGFQFGTASDPRYDGTNLAKKGVVVVSMNYRLGVFGYLARTDLDAEEPGKSSGMYGLQDQLAALGWVKTNIAAFGGDPQNITVFGESAGAHAVGMLLASPLSQGAFHKAIAESGAFWESPKGLMRSHAAATQIGAHLGAGIGATNLVQLRQASAAQLMADPTEPAYSPSVDGYVLPTDPNARFAAGMQLKVPLLAGTNANEGTIFSRFSGIPSDTKEHFVAAATAAIGSANMPAFLKFYPASTDAEAQQSQVLLSGDLIISSQTWQMTNFQKRAAAPVYSYYFNQVSPYTPLPVHVAEVPYVFQNLLPNGNGAPTANDTALADAMSTYWTNLARAGNPNSAALPNWPQYGGPGSSVMGLGPTVQSRTEVGTARFQFLNGLRHDGVLGVAY